MWLLNRWFLLMVLVLGCKKKTNTTMPDAGISLQLRNSYVNGVAGTNFTQVAGTPVVQFRFNTPLDRASVGGALVFANAQGIAVPFASSFANGDSTLNIAPLAPLPALASYSVTVSVALRSAAGKSLTNSGTVTLLTAIDSSDKFPRISTDSLLTLIQRQTFSYFWDFGHPSSGMARERNTSGELVTTGGSGFGIMSMVTATNRGFITRQQGLSRLNTITEFLENKAQRFKGAFPHWLNGSTGAVIPFSANDNGADLVETSFLAMGLLTARQYFNGASAEEVTLRNRINTIVDGIEWNWFRRNNEQVLYWHWSPDKAWTMNLKIQGWNECLITYVLAASSKNYSITDTVYHEGFARKGTMKNGASFLGTTLPLGPNLGGPLFLAHYSFLGINPTDLTDSYANYWTQNKNHTLINYNYCRTNTNPDKGYSALCWGLTASDIPNGYAASSPTNDLGVIAPTAAISSLPYTPAESLKAIEFFYYTLGDKLWKAYGFVDAFSLRDQWFATSFLAIDQGPQIVMIENYRSKLLWNLFTSCAEVKAGMKKLGFSAPYL